MAGAPSLPQVHACQSRAGTLYNTYTTAKSVINEEDVINWPANILRVGSAFRIKVKGGLSNRAATPGTFAFQLMMGSVVAWTSGNLSFNASARTLLPFSLDLELRLDSIGSGTLAKFMGMGEFGGIHLTNTDQKIQVPTTAPALGTGWASTAAQAMDLYVAFGTSDAGNGIQVQVYEVMQTAGFSV
jgi:hypothetical protein